MSAPHVESLEEDLDFAACEREPMHAPGHIQPDGVLIATYPDSWNVSHVSANFEASTGMTPAQALNAPLEDILGRPAFSAMKAALLGESETRSHLLSLALAIPVEPNRTVVAHRHLGRTILELEFAPLGGQRGISISNSQGLIASLSRAETIDELCQAAAQQFRRMSGYDRVVVYRFDEAGDGTVVAEDKTHGLEAYLGLKYPASDFPQTARDLYVTQRVHGISDVDYAPTPLLVAPGGEAELDMTYCAMRGISSVHLQYMRNMGVGAAVAISLLRNDALWGMIVGQHGAPLMMTADMRALSELVGHLMSVLLHKVAEASSLAERLKRHDLIAALRVQLEAADSIGAALSRQPSGVLELMGASGALVSLGGVTTLIGATPPVEVAIALWRAMRRHGDEIAAVSDAGRPGGIAAACAETASGILVMPLLNNPGDGIAWFRGELVQTVRWGGDPRRPMEVDPCGGQPAPRSSFAAWSELVRGRSAPWAPADLETAHELRRAVTGALLWHAEVKLAHLSAYDPLTTLANRRTLKAHLDRCRDAGEATRAAMLFLDLDRFKSINDSLGHPAGDQVLVQVAARLRRLSPPGAVASRLGGDEFVIFWPGAGHRKARALADRMLREMAEPFLLHGQAHYTTASIGVACCDLSGLDQLMRHADQAMYAAKRQGGARAVMFRPALQTAMLSAMQVEQDLFRAVENSELQIHYQPILSLPQCTVVGFEALVRWRHAERGWISPGKFIPRAEENGLITRIGAWVLAGAIRQISIWSRLYGDLTMSVNVSSRQLMEGSLSTLLAGFLAAEKVAPERIYLEVTESVLMNETAVRELHRLRDLGVKVAVDDFGTGYSSLAYLQRLPVDIVKIDRGFVSALGSSPKANRLFCAIVDLAHTLELRTVAEGCETEGQWRAISDAGCDAVQGWLISRALPPEAVGPFMKASRLQS